MVVSVTSDGTSTNRKVNLYVQSQMMYILPYPVQNSYSEAHSLSFCDAPHTLKQHKIVSVTH